MKILIMTIENIYEINKNIIGILRSVSINKMDVNEIVKKKYLLRRFTSYKH